MTEEQEATAYVYYYYTIKDIASGIDLQEIQGYLKMYEEAEMYDVCHGIKQGLDFASKATITELETEVEEIEKTIEYEIEED
jgi:hypothetical protein